MTRLMMADPVVETRPFTVPLHDPVHIRLAIHARGEACHTKDAYYLVLVGLFKLLRDLTVLRFHHSWGKEGLVFSLAVRESRSVVRSYLAETKKFHVLGHAWDVVIIDGARVSTVPGDSRKSLPLTEEMLSALAATHRQMGSRPLRFSRYFISAALLPFTRKRSYGCARMNAEDSRGKVNFYLVTQGLELLQRSFSSLDFSGISSTHALHIVADPLAKALQQIGRTTDFFAQLLFPALLLACLYEQKVPLSGMEEAFARLYPDPTEGLWLDARYRAKNFPGDFCGDEVAPGIGIHPGNRFNTEIGIEPGDAHFVGMRKNGGKHLEDIAHGHHLLMLRQLLDIYPNALLDLDTFSLFLLARMEDESTKRAMSGEQYRELRQLADLARQEKGVDRDQLNQLFFANRLVTEGVEASIVLFSLLSYMQEEEQS